MVLPHWQHLHALLPRPRTGDTVEGLTANSGPATARLEAGLSWGVTTRKHYGGKPILANPSYASWPMERRTKVRTNPETVDYFVP